MSVKRYQPVAQCVEPSYQAQMIVPKVMEFSEGEYVLHSDYARLKAEVDALKLGSLLTAVDVLQFIKLKEEVERLRASSFVTAVPVEEYEKLKAEVERLTKAEVERLKKDKPKTIEATYVVSAEDAKRIRARLDKMTENNETSPPTDGK